MFDLPLLGFFERLRQNEFPLGVDDYERFLKALRLSMGIDVSGFNELNDAFMRRLLPASDFETFIKPSILRICKILWLKPDQSTQLFEELFNATFSLDLGYVEPEKKVEALPSDKVIIQKYRGSGPQPPPILEPLPPDTPKDILPSSAIDLQEPVKVRIDLGTKTGDDLSLTAEDVEVEKNKFLFTENYYPIDRRKIQQNTRSYRTFRNVLSSKEIDLEATVNYTTKIGFFEKVIYKQLRQNTAQFIFLIDSGESMVAFRSLALLFRDDLEKASNTRGTKGQEIITWYFNPTCSKNVYADSAGIGATELNVMARSLYCKSATVVFFGEAGAAASTNDQQLVDTAKEMIEVLKTTTKKIVWMNPIPKDRWKRTAAKRINEGVAMFEADESGVKHAIDYLRGASVKILKSV